MLDYGQEFPIRLNNMLDGAGVSGVSVIYERKRGYRITFDSIAYGQAFRIPALDFATQNLSYDEARAFVCALIFSARKAREDMRKKTAA